MKNLAKASRSLQDRMIVCLFCRPTYFMITNLTVMFIYVNLQNKKIIIMNKSRVKPNDNIEFHIYIGQYKIVLNMPKETRVSDVINMVASYQNIHQNYGPTNSYFIGLASYDNLEIVDYWFTQPSFNFVKFHNKLPLKAIYSIEKKIDQITTNQLEFLKCLGEGACGSVFLVRSRVTGYLFALKRIKKDSFQNFQDILSLSREQKILKNLPGNNHTVKFHACFESVNHFNFLLEFYPGGQLFVHLRQQRLNEKEVKMYFCEVLAAIQFLHKNNILYRDLKPQNIFVDINGHLFIGDFGLSKCNFNEEDNANSHCGSPQYMAPQILQNKQYNFSSDFYSIGAILHEFVTGIPPYYDSGEQQRLSKMKKMNLNIDEYTNNQHIKNLIRGLLHPNPDQRISSFQQIKKSPWLADVDWKKVEDKTNIAPFAPNVYKTYINEQFLLKQKEVDEMNKYYESEKFQSSDFMDYIRPQSEKQILGRARTDIVRQHQMIKKKNNFTKEKSTKNLNNKSSITHSNNQSQANNIKGNISIALYEKHSHREERGDTASTSNSNISCYEAKTVKNAEVKENHNFKKQGSKKNLLRKVPSIVKNPGNCLGSTNAVASSISDYSNRKIGCSKQKSNMLTIKTRNNEMMMKSKGTLTPVNKSKSKQKSQQIVGLNKTKEQNYVSSKAKKQHLPVSSYKIKLM